MDPGSPSCTTNRVALPVPVPLLVVGALLRMVESSGCPLPPIGSSLTSAMNTCDGALAASLPISEMVLLPVWIPLEQPGPERGSVLGGWLCLACELATRVAPSPVVAAVGVVGARVLSTRRRVPKWLM